MFPSVNGGHNLKYKIVTEKPKTFYVIGYTVCPRGTRKETLNFLVFCNF